MKPSEPVLIARCLEHGLHGKRESCFDCGGPVEQVPLWPATQDSPFDPYTDGYLESLYMWAHMKEGVYYVGTTGTTLRAARRRFLDERGYDGVPDPFYVGRPE